MSTARIALRLAAIEALCPSGLVGTGPWPTLAGPRVYDSRIDLVEGDEANIAAIEGAPLIIVYTERDTLAPYGEIKYPAQENVAHLDVEILIAALGQVNLQAADGSTSSVGTIAAPITDRQHEALLDLLEAQVRRLLGKPLGYDMPPSAALYNSVAMEVRHIESVPQRSADRATRYAARTITFTDKIKAEKWPTADVAPAGIDLLPEPLRAVAKGLDAASSGYALCQSMIPWVNSPPARVPLTSIRAFLGMGETPAELDGADSSFQAALAFPRFTYFVLGF